MAFCGNCGTQLSKGAKFCPNCGQSVSETENSNASKPKVSKPKASKSRASKSKTREPRRNNAKKASRANIVNSDLSSSMKSGLGIAIIIAGIVFLASISNGMFIVSLVCVCAITACVLCFKEIIEQKFVWWVVAGSIIIPLLAMVISLLPDKPKKFEALKNGRAAYAINSAHYEKSDVKKISKIVMYKGNGRQDCKAEGVNGEGQLFTVDGKWEKKTLGKTSMYFYYLDYKYFKLLIRDDSLICYYKGDNDNVSSINKAWSENIIGKIKDLTQDAEDKISAETEKKKQEIEKERKAQLSKLMGNYYYSYHIGDTNAMLYFTITLKPDGTFIHKPSNETSENMVTLYKVVDGYYYPDGGKWELNNTSAGQAITLDFDGSWYGSIAVDNMVLEIKNMNGYNLKTIARR